MKDKKSPYCQCLLFSANALSRVMNRMAEEEFGLIGLAPSHAFILMSVIEKPGFQPTALCEMMMLTPSTVTRLIEKMETLELVERNTVGKCTFVYPTKKGVSMEKKVREAWSRISEKYCEKLGGEKTSELTDLVYAAATRLE